MSNQFYGSVFVVSILLVALATMTAGCQSTSRPPAAASAFQTRDHGVLLRSIAIGGVARKYAVYVPRDYTPALAMPAIVFLNGSGECGVDGQKQLTQGLIPAVLSDSAAWPFVVICPQKPESKSQWIDYDEMVMAILAATRTELNIDSSRTYLTGLSQGGAGTWAIAAKHPELFAAIAPICGYGTPTPELGAALKSMPLWAFHGNKDDVVLPAKTQALVECVKAAGGSPKFTLFPDANHNSWDAAYRTQKLGEWFLSFRRP